MVRSVGCLPICLALPGQLHDLHGGLDLGLGWLQDRAPLRGVPRGERGAEVFEAGIFGGDLERLAFVHFPAERVPLGG
jgi:hypothetical protein